MITDQARSAIDRIFTDAVRMNLPLDSSDRIELTHQTAGAGAKTGGRDLMVVTSSSFAFRMLTMFRLGETGECAGYYARGRADVPLTEAFSEVANLCCGTINRHLARYFPHLGMSTPYVLSSQCLDFIADLRPQHVARVDVAINEKVRIQVTLCVCGSAPIDFVATAPLIEESPSNGELEFL